MMDATYSFVWLWWLLAVLPVCVLLLTMLNLVLWPRGRRAKVDNMSVSVLIPARNEEASIGEAISSALDQVGPVKEVIVYDDQSTDRTPQIIEQLASRDQRVRSVRGEGLPDGWVGKPHACHRLAQEATGDLLLFIDADVELSSDGINRLQVILAEYDADAVTGVPRQLTDSFTERLVIPLLHVTYLSWLPLPLIWRTSDPRFLAANGQLLAVSRAAYDETGGFAAVRDAVVDDMAFCGEMKRGGRRVVFADGFHVARCRMYENALGVWEGFSKNIYEGIGSSTGLALALLLYFATFVLPWIALPVALLVAPSLVWPAALAVLANVLQRAILVVRFAHPPEGIILHPLSVLVLGAIAINSWVWHLRSEIVWAGRTYPRRGARGG